MSAICQHALEQDKEPHDMLAKPQPHFMSRLINERYEVPCFDSLEKYNLRLSSWFNLVMTNKVNSKTNFLFNSEIYVQLYLHCSICLMSHHFLTSKR